VRPHGSKKLSHGFESHGVHTYLLNISSLNLEEQLQMVFLATGILHYCWIVVHNTHCSL